MPKTAEEEWVKWRMDYFDLFHHYNDQAKNLEGCVAHYNQLLAQAKNGEYGTEVVRRLQEEIKELKALVAKLEDRVIREVT